MKFIINTLVEQLINNNIIERKMKQEYFYVHIPAKQHNRPEGTACYSASNCTL